MRTSCDFCNCVQSSRRLFLQTGHLCPAILITPPGCSQQIIAAGLKALTLDPTWLTKHPLGCPRAKRVRSHGQPSQNSNMAMNLACTPVLLPLSQNGWRSVPQVCLGARGSDPQSSDPGIWDKKDYIWRGDPERWHDRLLADGRLFSLPKDPLFPNSFSANESYLYLFYFFFWIGFIELRKFTKMGMVKWTFFLILFTKYMNLKACPIIKMLLLMLTLWDW